MTPAEGLFRVGDECVNQRGAKFTVVGVTDKYVFALEDGYSAIADIFQANGDPVVGVVRSNLIPPKRTRVVFGNHYERDAKIYDPCVRWYGGPVEATKAAEETNRTHLYFLIAHPAEVEESVARRLLGEDRS